MTEHAPHISPDAEIVLAWITRGYHAEGHHPNCSTRADEGCDCYARASFPARDALRRLEEQLETARADLHEVWDLIWNQDGPYIEGGDRMLDEWAQKVRPRYGFEASDPATETADERIRRVEQEWRESVAPSPASRSDG